MSVTAISEVRVPGCDELIGVRLDDSLYLVQLSLGESLILCQFDSRFKPEFGLSVRRTNMDMPTGFFEREEEKPISLLSENGGTH